MSKNKEHMQGGGESVPNLAPLVDVIMVLLIFFLMGTTINEIKEGALETELDASSGPGNGAQVDIIQGVDIQLDWIEGANGDDGVEIMVGGTPIPDNTFEGLRKFLTQKRLMGAQTDRPTTINADVKVRWKFVVQAMDAAVRSGFGNIQFMTGFGG